MKLYNLSGQKSYMYTAGKITIATAITGIMVFVLAFVFKAGTTELMKVEAQNNGTASTTLTVLNTPPQWFNDGRDAREEFESSTSSPTNSSNTVAWVATAFDNSAQPYFLLICDTNVAPVATSATTTLGTNPPRCASGVQWAVSTGTVSGQGARASRVTTEVAPFNPEELSWYAWICDDDLVLPRCNAASKQGLTATNSSPFIVNFRPTFTSATTTPSPVNPDSVLTFTTVSIDGNIVRPRDNIWLFVCATNTFNPVTRDCPGQMLASSTVGVANNAGTAFTLPAVVQDQLYNAFVYIIDEFNHPAQGSAHGSNIGFRVANVAPTVLPGNIDLNGGNLTLTVGGGQTTGFRLDFTVTDANSCVNAASTTEITGFDVRIFRTGTSSCDGTPGSYNPNSCYPSSLSPSTWNLSCTASTTSCTGNQDPTLLYQCTFPLWFVADPTDAISPFVASAWTAAVAGVDDQNATGTIATTSSPRTLISFPFFSLLQQEIPYGSLEPGQPAGPLSATTTIESRGNTGLDQDLSGASMCTTYTPNTPCPNNITSTIAAGQQRYATNTVAYGTGTPMSSTTPALLALNVPKSTSTTTPAARPIYWGVEVPVVITVAGNYRGMNTFVLVVSSSTNW